MNTHDCLDLAYRSCVAQDGAPLRLELPPRLAPQPVVRATIRCIPLDAGEEEGGCIVCGKPSRRRVVFAKAY